jgi:hypothetical protein
MRIQGLVRTFGFLQVMGKEHSVALMSPYRAAMAKDGYICIAAEAAAFE